MKPRATHGLLIRHRARSFRFFSYRVGRSHLLCFALPPGEVGHRHRRFASSFVSEMSTLPLSPGRSTCFQSSGRKIFFKIYSIDSLLDLIDAARGRRANAAQLGREIPGALGPDRYRQPPGARGRNGREGRSLIIRL